MLGMVTEESADIVCGCLSWPYSRQILLFSLSNAETLYTIGVVLSGVILYVLILLELTIRNDRTHKSSLIWSSNNYQQTMRPPNCLQPSFCANSSIPSSIEKDFERKPSMLYLQCLRSIQQAFIRKHWVTAWHTQAI